MKVRWSNGKFSTIHGMSWTRMNKIWVWIKNRCTNPNNAARKRYWWAWIKCCWDTFLSFYNDMSDTYQEWLSIDRIDWYWDYCKENCRWATMKEQQNNRKNNHIITYNWMSLTMKQRSEKLWINYRTLSTRINRDKISIEQSLQKYTKNLQKKIRYV